TNQQRRVHLSEYPVGRSQPPVRLLMMVIYTSSDIFVRMRTNKAAVIHTLIWIVLLLVLFFVNARGQNEETAIVVFLFGGLNIAVFYFQYFLINPLFIGGHKYARTIAYMTAVLVVSVAIKYAVALQFESFILRYGDDH